MTQLDNLIIESRDNHAARHDNGLLETASRLCRESEMIGLGVGGAVLDTVRNPLPKLPELAISFAAGSALGAVSRLGAPGKVVSAGIGGAMLVKLGYDELSGNRWSRLAGAVKDTWRSADHLQQNIDITRDSLGSFVVDTAIGSAGMKLSSLAVSRFAPPARLEKYAVRQADFDGGSALRSLQNRWENPKLFKQQVEGKLDLITHTQPAVPGQARGDLIRVATTPEGNILVTAMDVQGHGVGAAKKAVTVHSAIDSVLPHTRNKSASDILSMIDGKLNSKDELSITAGLMNYNPATHRLQTATASSEFAFVVRSYGAVRQLDAKVGGLGLGSDLYASFPKGNEVIRLNRGDTVVLASDGAFDRFGYGNVKAFETFLKKTGPNPEKIRQGILNTPAPETGADDTSFIIFRRP